MDPGINYEDITLEELSEKIFDYPIKDRCSVPISFDGINLKEMHEALLMFFTNGMKKKLKTQKIYMYSKEKVFHSKNQLSECFCF